MKYIIGLILLLVPLSALWGQINYYRVYSGDGFDFGNSIVQMQDSGFVLAGTSGSFSQGGSQAFLMRTDKLGNYQWSRGYGGIENESAEKVIYQENFGFFLTGYTNSYGAGGYDFYLVKIQEDGTPEWERTYGSSGWEKVVDAALTRDTGLIMVGELDDGLSDNKEIWMVRVDKSGDTLWTKTLGGPGDDYATSILSYQDSLFIVSANVYIPDSSYTRGYLYYMTEDGVILSEDTLGSNPGWYNINDFAIANDTIFGFGSHRIHDTLGSDLHYYRYKIGATELSWIEDFSVHSAEDYFGDLITNYGNTSYKYAAYRVEAWWGGVGGPDLHVGRLWPILGWNGGVGILNGDNPDVGGEFIRTSDGGAALIGYTSSIGIGGASIFLMKIGEGEVYPVIDGVTLYSQLVSIDDLTIDPELNVYPNPSRNSITIEWEGGEQGNLIIYDVAGKNVKSTTIDSADQIDISDLEQGAYWVQLQYSADKVTTFRMIKN